MADHRTDRAVERLARVQHGAFSAAQARAVGATRSMIGTRRQTGQWLQLAPSVFALPGIPPTWHRQVMAAHLSAPHSSVAGLAAGHLLGLDGYRPVRPELRVPRGAGHRTSLATVHQSDRFLARPIGPFSVATVEQTFCDTAGRLGGRLDDAVHAALTTGRTSPAALMARCDALRPRLPKGVERLVLLALEHSELPPVPMTVLEAALFRILADPRIPAWQAQATPSWWPDDRERLDAFVPAWRLVVEADGRAWHTRRRDFENDRRRDHVALTHGCRIVRFTYEQLLHEPEYVLRVLLAIGASVGSGASTLVVA
jgi:very-short-patch-repair endonuclease